MNPLAALGRWIHAGLQGAGRFTRFTAAVVHSTVAAASQWGRWNRLAPVLVDVGTRSIPVIVLIGAFIGMILALETWEQFAAVGMEDRLGMIINVSVVRQIGPVLAALMVAGRVGCALAAELGSMRVTEQIDAMRALGVDPVTVLVVPRVVACTIMTPVLTIISDVTGVAGGYFFTVVLQGASSDAYWANTEWFVGWWAPTMGLIKATAFGFAIGLIACYKGYTCRGGAAGVGRATTRAFVAAFMAIIVLNFFLADFLNTFERVVLGASVKSPL
ncbi:MAG: ABC transporter permease [Phycisphaerales bacterium]|nr:ABC transporter permease [Phycisphaerales bacterium]